MREYYKDCEYVCYSRARGFESKEPVPTCRRFHYNTLDDSLRGTYERCCDVAITGRCLIDEAKEIEQNEIDLFAKEYQKYCENRKRLREKGYNTKPY